MPPDDFNAASLDDVIHGKLRLGLMSYLSSVDGATFSELRARTGATDGNLSVHLTKLEDAGYIKITKTFVGKRPQTTARLTAKGRKAWIAYLDQMRALLDGSD